MVLTGKDRSNRSTASGNEVPEKRGIVNGGKASPASIYRMSTNPQIGCNGDFWCGSKYCKRCSGVRAWSKAKNVLSNIPHILSEETQRIRLTFTIKNDHDIHRNIRDIRRAFEKIRRSSYWVKNVIGGIWFFHITHNEETGFHTHFDCFIEARQLDKIRLMEIWCKLTGGSTNVGFEYIQETDLDHQRLVHYQSQSVIKNFDDRSMMETVLIATKGKQKSGRMGTWRNSKDNPKRWLKYPNMKDYKQDEVGETTPTEDTSTHSNTSDAPETIKPVTACLAVEIDWEAEWRQSSMTMDQAWEAMDRILVYSSG